jgi:zinc transport system permease protein
MSSIITFWFFQKALIISLLAAIPCAIIGTYVVIKRISMISGSMSHATFGGLGIAYFLGINPLIGATIFGLLSGTTVGVIKRKAKNRLDPILSFIWAFGMAIGLIFVYLTPGYSSDLFTYLFGNIFLITNAELISLAIINVIIVLVVLLTFQTIQLVLFDEEYAEVRNIPIMLVNVLFYVLVALTIIVILSIVGVILLIAFLTLPAAISLFYQRTIKRTMIMSGIIIAVSNIAGLFLAHVINLPPGPVIVVLLSALYIISLGYDWLRKTLIKRRNLIEPHACDMEMESFGIFQHLIRDEHIHDHVHEAVKDDSVATET